MVSNQGLYVDFFHLQKKETLWYYGFYMLTVLLLGFWKRGPKGPHALKKGVLGFFWGGGAKLLTKSNDAFYHKCTLHKSHWTVYCVAFVSNMRHPGCIVIAFKRPLHKITGNPTIPHSRSNTVCIHFYIKKSTEQAFI